MKLRVRLFATLKDRAGDDTIEVEVTSPATVETLLAAVAGAYPALAPALPTTLVAVNRTFAFAGTPIAAGDEVALFPPVSGGEELPHPTYFAVTDEAPDMQAIFAHLVEPDVGAVVSFTGAVRGKTNRQGLPPSTLRLEYEAYQAMAEERMVQIAHEIWRQWPLVKGVAIVQRVGRLEVGEITTLVACAAGHRDEGAFEAARYGIDRLKEIVPVWKKEIGGDHSTWVEGHYRPTAADNEGSR